ncbi:PP2C family serine/threonine-protein phosphatase [Chitinophaga nivalis]|uniref:Protein phosphatase 2C domain-containing protein n=1 Tax=Chitinophaga nivalis TaxID=2991709 RepID=A0ABT3IJ64_9BACT|nr:PP2C family serine/threonine-protein phosphatase [Chitinophaga nivalis]MCW3466314.1 protein phosphatase 2C domain-containing protein [Chitinophaga nivalis]MCW3483995.1 protein phosphatase 2C domain-containing protein [Chitinophaga nivalis]
MSTERTYIEKLFAVRNIPLASNRQQLFEAFVKEEAIMQAAKQILENQQLLMDTWQFKNRLADIQQQSVSIPNATVGKVYEAKLDFIKLNWKDFIFSDIAGLEAYGLTYDNEKESIQGTPVKSGDIKVTLQFRLAGEAPDAALHEKIIPLVINPNPKSLWKNIDSDKNAPFWKEDNVAVAGVLGEKQIVVASKRGRSHANVGSFRDDDFAFKHFDDSGWSVLAVSDGAGSARLSREGARIACTGIVEYFEQNFTAAVRENFDTLVGEHAAGAGADTQKKLAHFVYENLGKAALSVHKKLEDFATKLEVPVKDFHATLIFALLKKYPFGYAILTFGVGDCPIGLLNKDLTEITLMNWLDVGEFGGGTRFITMPEIFKSDKFATRFGFRLVPDFAYLMLMTDGIYDPKFVVEANLEKITAWQELLADLGGKNDDQVTVELNSGKPEVAAQLSAWMDFWSPGNHDDRTLMIVS